MCVSICACFSQIKKMESLVSSEIEKPSKYTGRNWFSYTLDRLKELQILNVKPEDYHEFLTSGYGKNYPIQFRGMHSPRGFRFEAYLDNADIYEFVECDEEDEENDNPQYSTDVKLSLMPHLPTEYSTEYWSVFLELPNKEIKFLFQYDYDTKLSKKDHSWAVALFGPNVKLFGLRKKKPVYVFQKE